MHFVIIYQGFHILLAEQELENEKGDESKWLKWAPH